MNTKKYFLFILISVITLSGCGLTIRQHPGRSGEWNHDYRRGYNQRINNNEKRIKNLKSSGHRDRVYVIEIDNNNMRAKLNSFKGNSRNEWDSFRYEFDKDLKSVEKNIKDFNRGNKKSNKNRNKGNYQRNR